MPPTQPQSREKFIAELFAVTKPDNFLFSKEARDKIITGINKVVDLVKAGYGPAGSSTIIEEHETPGHRISNDGKRIADSVHLSDPYENIGANIVKEVAAKSDKESGDGRKTSMILLQAILKEGMKVATHEGNLMEIKKSLNECLPIILKSIDDQTKQITTKEVGQVAAIAGESEILGRLFMEIYQKIGKDGIIELDNSGTNQTTYEVVEGIKLLNCGWLKEYMTNNGKGTEAIHNNPYILITKDKINKIQDLNKVLTAVNQQEANELVIFFDDMDSTVMMDLACLYLGVDRNGQPTGRSPFKITLIKAPTLWKDWLFEDFAKVTNATIVDKSIGRPLTGVQLSWLGRCSKLIVKQKETIVIGTQDVKEYIEQLLETNTDDSTLRASRLSTKTAILKLGANSESELSHFSGKALDARNSSYLALQGGVVRGAGKAMLYTHKDIPDTIGGKILKQAIAYPYTLIMHNMGITTANMDKFDEKLDQVFDSAIVIKNAITNAISVASTILTTSSVIINK